MVDRLIIVAIWVMIASFFFAFNLRAGSAFGKRFSYMIFTSSAGLAVALAIITTVEHF